MGIAKLIRCTKPKNQAPLSSRKSSVIPELPFVAAFMLSERRDSAFQSRLKLAWDLSDGRLILEVDSEAVV